MSTTQSDRYLRWFWQSSFRGQGFDFNMGLPVIPNPVALHRCFDEYYPIRSLFTVVSRDPEHTSMQSCSGSGSRHEFVSPTFRPPLRGIIPFMVAEPRLAIVIGLAQHNRWQPWATHMAKNTKINDALPKQQQQIRRDCAGAKMVCMETEMEKLREVTGALH